VNNLTKKTASIDAYTGDITSYIGTIYTNTLTGGTASFNYIKGGTSAFNYITGGTASFNYITGGTASLNYITGGTASFNYITGSTASFNYLNTAYIKPTDNSVISFGVISGYAPPVGPLCKYDYNITTGIMQLYTTGSSSYTPTLKIDGSNGFISNLQQESYNLGSMNPTIAYGICNNDGSFNTFNLIATSPTIAPGQYSLTLAKGTTYTSIGGVSIDIKYSTDSGNDYNYVSLMVLASSSPISGTWETTELNGNNYSIASSSSVSCIHSNSPNLQRCFFSINNTIIITPDKPYLSIILGIKVIDGDSFTFEDDPLGNPSLPIYVPAPDYATTDNNIWLIPVS
jgi:hypothetical protein